MSEEAVADNSAAPAKTGGLRRVLLRGSAFEMLGFGASQLIRFGSNLLLSRLLFPEAFGLAALVNILNYGLVMLSDVGLPSMIAIRSARAAPAASITARTSSTCSSSVAVPPVRSDMPVPRRS